MELNPNQFTLLFLVSKLLLMINVNVIEAVEEQNHSNATSQSTFSSSLTSSSSEHSDLNLTETSFPSPSTFTATTLEPEVKNLTRIEYYREYLVNGNESDSSLNGLINNSNLNADDSANTIVSNDVLKVSNDAMRRRKQHEEEEGRNGKDISSTTTTHIYIIAIIGIVPAAIMALLWSCKYYISTNCCCIKTQMMQPHDDESKVAKSRTQKPLNSSNPLSINQNAIGEITYKIVQRANEKLNESSSGHRAPEIWDNKSYNQNIPSSFVKSRRVYSLEMPRKNLEMIEVLGEGNFGQVWKARVCPKNETNSTQFVAVKTNKINTKEKDAEELLKELDIMLQFGTSHPNVVRLLGCCTENQPYFLIMEYLCHGKLLTYLRNHRSDRTYTSSYTSYYNCNNNNSSSVERKMFLLRDGKAKTEDEVKKTLSSKDLILFAYQIAKGMEFINSHGIIHRDLASRNVLIDERKTCKVADFGLSRSIRDKESDMYEMKTKGEMPIRWMSPESLQLGQFSSKSDVWAFGVLLWELITLGSTPYVGMSASQVVKSVKEGYILEQPNHCNNEFYSLMKSCWSYEPSNRKSFTQLRANLAKMIESQLGYIDLDKFPDQIYSNLYKSTGEKV